jgi:hypothetical protein
MALRLVASGEPQVLFELCKLTEAAAQSVAEIFSSPINKQILRQITDSIPPDVERDAKYRRRKYVRVFLLKVYKELPLDEALFIISRWKRLGAGPWREFILRAIERASLNDFLSFIGAAKYLDAQWDSLPAPFREASLEAWLVHRGKPSLRLAAIANCVSIPLDAAEWANDGDALVDVLLSAEPLRHSQRVLGLFERWRKYKWDKVIESVLSKQAVPASLFDLAKLNSDVLRNLLERAPAGFRSASLAGFSVPTLLSFVHRIDGSPNGSTMSCREIR